MRKKPTIEELEKILNAPDGKKIRILPNGKIKTISKKETIEESLITHSEKIGELTKNNKILRATLLHCLGHLQIKIENNSDMITLQKIQTALAQTGEQ